MPKCGEEAQSISLTKCYHGWIRLGDLVRWSGVMADACVLVEEETKNATKELTDSLLSINGKTSLNGMARRNFLSHFYIKNQQTM